MPSDLLRQVRCRKCKRWFGRHAPLVLHGDGKTDDTAALQHMLDTEGRIRGWKDLPHNEGAGHARTPRSLT